MVYVSILIIHEINQSLKAIYMIKMISFKNWWLSPSVTLFFFFLNQLQHKFFSIHLKERVFQLTEVSLASFDSYTQSPAAKPTDKQNCLTWLLFFLVTKFEDIYHRPPPPPSLPIFHLVKSYEIIKNGSYKKIGSDLNLANHFNKNILNKFPNDTI